MVDDLDNTLSELTIDGYHSAMRRGDLTAAELVDWYLARIPATTTQVWKSMPS